MGEYSKLKLFGIGVLMGTADAIPGVSGGTIALIAGIYDRLITSITSITLYQFVELSYAIIPVSNYSFLERSKTLFNELDFWFLFILLAGICTAIVTVGEVVDYLNRHAPVPLFGFFFGLIGSSAIILAHEITVKTGKQILIAFLGFLVAFVLSGSIHLVNSSGPLATFFAGGMAVSAMILPGISGSLLLVILGQYTRMYAVLGQFIDGIITTVTGGPISVVVDPGRVVLTFMFGGFVGLFTIARLIRKMITVNREATMAFLVALVFGALRAPVTELSSREGFVWTTGSIGKFASVAVIGAMLVFILMQNTADIKINDV